MIQLAYRILAPTLIKTQYMNMKSKTLFVKWLELSRKSLYAIRNYFILEPLVISHLNYLSVFLHYNYAKSDNHAWKTVKLCCEDLLL